MLRVRDSMTREVVTLGPEASAAEAWGVCQELGIRHLPIIEEGRLVGLVSDRDLRDVSPPRGSGGERDTLGWVRLRDIMSTDLVTTHPLDTIEHAAREIYDRKIGCLPVVADGELVRELGRGRGAEPAGDAGERHRRDPGAPGQHSRHLPRPGAKGEQPPDSAPPRDHEPHGNGPEPGRGRLQGDDRQVLLAP